MCIQRIKVALVVSIVLAAFLSYGTSATQCQNKRDIKSAKVKSDAEAIEDLASNDSDVAEKAADEILLRGERMIPLLIKRRGDKRNYRGFLTRNPMTASGVVIPSGNPRSDRRLLREGRLVTIEVAALYLIEAIYYGTLNIAQSPYLTDLSLPSVQRRQLNTAPLVHRAWKAVDGWYKRLAASDLAQLRAKHDNPLGDGNVDFW